MECCFLFVKHSIVYQFDLTGYGRMGSVRMTALLAKETHFFCKLSWPMHRVFLVHRLQVQVPWLKTVKILRVTFTLKCSDYRS